MKRLLFILLASLCMIYTSWAQNVGINDNNSSPNTSAMLDVYSTTTGMLIPRVALTSTSSASPITSPATSLLVYNTATVSDVIPGYYYWDSSKWVRLQATGTGIQKLVTVTKTTSGTIAKTDNLVFASGDITLTLPVVTSADNGLEISVKDIGTYMDVITVTGATGAEYIDASLSSTLYKNWGRTYIAKDGNWYKKENLSRPDNEFDVSDKSSWTTIAQVIEFLNSHMTGPSIVKLGGGTYPISTTQTINLSYPLTFEGSSFGETIISGSGSLFTCSTECYFKMIIFNGSSGDAITFTGSGVYHEVKDCTLSGFAKGIVATNNNDLWIFENDFDNCTVAGIEIAAGTASGGRLRVSETDFTQCAKGINLLSAASEIVSIINCSFYNTSAGSDIGIFYTPATFTSFSTMFITHNMWNNQGTFMSGFDFARTDGRDANAYLINNLGQEDENPHCKLTLLNNSTSVAANGTTYVKANWTTSSPTLTTYTCKWNLATTNRLTYQSIQKSDVVMWVSGNVSASNSNRVINIGICKNGVTTTRYGETTVRTATAGQPYQFSTIIYLPSVSATDYYEIWFNSTAGVTDNIIFADLNWYVDAK